jgi:hypothetical protein
MDTIIDDSEFKIPKFSEICTFCANETDGYHRKCKAFDSIPMEIWLGKNDHRKPYPNDRGIQFSPVKGAK